MKKKKNIKCLMSLNAEIKLFIFIFLAFFKKTSLIYVKNIIFKYLVNALNSYTNNLYPLCKEY